MGTLNELFFIPLFTPSAGFKAEEDEEIVAELGFELELEESPGS